MDLVFIDSFFWALISAATWLPSFSSLSARGQPSTTPPPCAHPIQERFHPWHPVTQLEVKDLFFRLHQNVLAFALVILVLIFGMLVFWYTKLLLNTEILVIILVEYRYFNILKNLKPESSWDQAQRPSYLVYAKR